VTELGEFVNHYQNGISRPTLGKALNKVHGHNIPSSIRDWKRLKQSRIPAAIRFGLLTN
jgi:hypothetical protein